LALENRSTSAKRRKQFYPEKKQMDQSPQAAIQNELLVMCDMTSTHQKRMGAISRVKALRQPAAILQFVVMVCNRLEAALTTGDRSISGEVQNLFAGVILKYIVEHGAFGRIVPHVRSLKPMLLPGINT
jgi:hypothetical protein